MESCRFILGEEVSLLEQELSVFTGAKYAVGVGSGTDGLLISLLANGIGPGHVVITTPFTFIATAEVISLLGARPVFVDIDPETFNLDVSKLSETLEGLQRRGTPANCVIPVSLYGLCPEMDAINAVAQSHGLLVIEDACQSLGSLYKEQSSCNLCKVGVTSFFPSKPLGCFGDGGMIFTSEQSLAEKFKALRVHGQTARYEHEFIGINGRLDALQAAVLRVKLKYFSKEISSRQGAAAYYSKLLEPLREEIIPQYIPGHCESVFAQYTIRIKNGKRDKVAEFLKARGIPTAIHYPMPLHLQKAFARLGYSQGDLPVAEKASREVLSLPMHAFIKESEQDQVVSAIRDAIKN
ncbi:MAG: aminotransferase DegT [Thermodesulfatator sp.]|nr:MAG: aminotransferase DegT [Thermodesulfatator sp.]